MFIEETQTLNDLLIKRNAELLAENAELHKSISFSESNRNYYINEYEKLRASSMLVEKIPHAEADNG